MKILAQVITAIFLPLNMVVAMLAFLIYANPEAFTDDPNQKGREVLWLSTFFTTWLIPLIGTVMIVVLGFANKFSLEDHKERIGPLMITAVMYIWAFLSLKIAKGMYPPFIGAVLGATISIMICFFITVFQKVSLHANGMGGTLGFLLVLYFTKSYHTVPLTNPSVSMVTIIAFWIGCTAAVWWARKELKAHTNQDLIGGFVVGLCSQVIGAMFFH
jgi:hypothetical protein